MASWYYVDQGNNRKGPVPAEELAAAYRQGQVSPDSLVWRDGMAEWAPLGDHLDELGLERAQATAAPAKNKNGCLIAAAIIIGGGAFLLVILGILAAIAIPAYQDYIVRAKVSQALAEVQPARIAVSEFVAGADRCPRDAGELGLAPPDGTVLESVEVGSLEDGSCAVELVLAADLSPPKLSNAVILLTLADDGRWICSSDELRETDLPSSCR